MWKKIGLIGLMSLMGLINPIRIYAADFKSDYQVEYFLNENAGKIETKAKFIIKITNLTSEVYVKKFSLGFPKIFHTTDVTASDDKGPIKPQVETDELQTKINLEFTDPQTGRNSENFFYLDFHQDNLFQLNGNIWEVILPTIQRSEESNYKIVVNVPQHTGKKLSIAKPKPTFIRDNQIVWQNPESRTIYAVFGDTQYYNTTLTYNLENTNFTPVYTEIALPPDTLYQKTYLHSLQPQPVLVYLDEDGNYMARYNLSSKQRITVVYKGVIQLYTNYRQEVQPYVEQSFASQKNYLLSPQKYWEISSLNEVKDLHSAQDIFNFTTSKLRYNYSKVSQNSKRIGAEAVLQARDQAVCTEFSDLFVGIAREKGVSAREVEGYGFANDPQLRPLSLISDVLHSWPEYYDEAKHIWIPVDPTWENTSGIDYFTSFDLNHITFAIHGKKSDYPLPAGTYKTEQSRDVTIQANSEIPEAHENLSIELSGMNKKITDKGSNSAKLVVVNTGNVYLWNIPIQASSDVIHLDYPNSVAVLAPFEKKEIPIQYSALTNGKKNTGKLKIEAMGKEFYNAQIEVVPYTYDLGLKIAYVVIGIAVVVFGTKYVISARR